MQPATLRLDVKTAEASTGGRRTRQVREPVTAYPSGADQTPEETTEPTTEAYNPDVEDARNRVQRPSQAEDQYSRDRYGPSSSDDQVGQSRGAAEDRGYPQQPGFGAGSRVAPGEMVNAFECVINLASAGNQQAHTAQWQTLSCRPQFPNSQEWVRRNFTVFLLPFFCQY